MRWGPTEYRYINDDSSSSSSSAEDDELLVLTDDFISAGCCEDDTCHPTTSGAVEWPEGDVWEQLSEHPSTALKFQPSKRFMCKGDIIPARHP